MGLVYHGCEAQVQIDRGLGLWGFRRRVLGVGLGLFSPMSDGNPTHEADLQHLPLGAGALREGRDLGGHHVAELVPIHLEPLTNLREAAQLAWHRASDLVVAEPEVRLELHEIAELAGDGARKRVTGQNEVRILLAHSAEFRWYLGRERVHLDVEDLQ